MKRAAETVLNVYDFENLPRIGDVAKRAAVQLNTGSLPQYERADLFPSNASALNKATEYDYIPQWLPMDDVNKFDEATIRYQVAAGAYYGGRLIRETDIPHFKWMRTPDKKYHRISEEHMLNVRSEAPRGLHGISAAVRETIRQQQVTSTGAYNRMRADGFERDDNRKIFPRLPTGLPMAVDTQRSTLDADRINDKMVEPISVFPSIGF